MIAFLILCLIGRIFCVYMDRRARIRHRARSYPYRFFVFHMEQFNSPSPNNNAKPYL